MSYDDADMCPNCVTPWKCNGPHLADQTEYVLSGRAEADAKVEMDSIEDALDGAALRRLREAVAQQADKRWRVTVLLSEPDAEPGKVWANASRRNEFNGLDIIPHPDATDGSSPTIADAADKCREALG